MPVSIRQHPVRLAHPLRNCAAPGGITREQRVLRSTLSGWRDYAAVQKNTRDVQLVSDSTLSGLMPLRWQLKNEGRMSPRLMLAGCGHSVFLKSFLRRLSLLAESNRLRSSRITSVATCCPSSSRRDRYASNASMAIRSPGRVMRGYKAIEIPHFL